MLNTFFHAILALQLLQWVVPSVLCDRPAGDEGVAAEAALDDND